MDKDIVKLDSNVYKISEPELKILEYWQLHLELLHWQIDCIPILEMQVVDDLKGGVPGNEFVGVTIDNLKFRADIFHTRPLIEEDIIHELLHVKFQEWSESLVVKWTDILVSLDNPKLILTELFKQYA